MDALLVRPDDPTGRDATVAADPDSGFRLAIVELAGEPSVAGLRIESAGVVPLVLAGRDPRFEGADLSELTIDRDRDGAVAGQRSPTETAGGFFPVDRAP